MKIFPRVPLGECLAEPPAYGANASAVEFCSELPRYIRITDIDSDGRLVEDGKKSIPAAAAKSYILQRGDIVFARTGATVGKTYLHNGNEQDFAFAGYLIRFRTNPEKLLPKFLSLYTQSEEYDRWLTVVSRSGAQPNVNAAEYCSLEIPLPPLSEQIEIARILGVWDAATGETSQLIAAKTRRKRALMQQLLTGERRFAEFEGQAFVSRAIGEVLALRSRLVEWDDEETYRLASVRRNSGGLFWREELRGDQIKVKKLHTVHAGDFLISHIQAAYGAMGCVPDGFDGGHVSDMYSILTPRAGAEGAEVDIRFVDYLAQTPVMHRHILQSSNGFFAERLRLNFDPLEFLKQPLDLPPTLAEQRRIAEVLDAATREIELLQLQLDALKTQKRGLMQLLLSGEKRVGGAAAGNLDDVRRSNPEGER